MITNYILGHELEKAIKNQNKIRKKNNLFREAQIAWLWNYSWEDVELSSVSLLSWKLNVSMRMKYFLYLDKGYTLYAQNIQELWFKSRFLLAKKNPRRVSGASDPEWAFHKSKPWVD